MTLQVEQFMSRGDNFGVLIHDPETGATASIDAPEEAPIRAALERTGWQLTHILTTHWHNDHVEANEALKKAFGVEIIGPEAEKAKIPGIDRTVGGGDSFTFGSEIVEVIDTPGHTAGHIVYHFPQSKLLFAGDTLFALGCGRLFEAPADVMHASLSRLAALPGDTAVYCGHEYTLSNARFAVTVDPGNAALAARLKEIEDLRSRDEPTLPTTIARELETNPFLRASDPSIRRHLGMEGASDVEVFAEIRKRKDNF